MNRRTPKRPTKRLVKKATKSPGLQPVVPEPDWDLSRLPAPYADVVRSTLNERQFLLYFGQSDPDTKKFTVAARVFLNPQTTGELLAVLAEQVDKYQKRFGKKITPEGFSLKALKKG